MGLTAEETKNKALFQYRGQVMELLKPLQMYGQKPYCEQVVKEFEKIAMQLHDRLTGKDVPIQANRPHWWFHETGAYNPDD